MNEARLFLKIGGRLNWRRNLRIIAFYGPGGWVKRGVWEI